jgi:hypothetical protein
MVEVIMNKPNYIVHLNDFRKDIECDTKNDVWNAIQKQGWGGYGVSSPVGLDTSEFIPF